MDRHTVLDPRTDDQRLQLEICVAKHLQGIQKWRHDTGNNYVVDIGEMQSAETEQFMNHHRPLIRGPGLVRGQAPTANELFTPVKTENRIGIANIYNEEHKNPRRVARGAWREK